MDKKPNTERISEKNFLNTFKEALDLKEGWLYTFQELTFRPGSALKRYLDGDRKLTNPIKYFLLAISLSFLATFLVDTFGPTDTSIARGDFEEQVTIYVVVISLNLGFTFILFLFNRKKGFNFFEYLIVSIYWFTHILIVTIIIIDFGGLILYVLSGNNEFVTSGVRALIGLTMVISYLFWAIKSFLTISLLKSSLIMMVVLIVWSITMVIEIEILISIFKNSDTEIGIVAGLPEEEKEIYGGKVFSAWESTLQVDSVIINGPAWIAGIVKGDTILSINGEKINWVNFKERITDFESGETILLTIQRNGLKHDIPITLTNSDSLKHQTQYPKPN